MLRDCCEIAREGTLHVPVVLPDQRRLVSRFVRDARRFVFSMNCPRGQLLSIEISVAACTRVMRGSASPGARRRKIHYAEGNSRISPRRACAPRPDAPRGGVRAVGGIPSLKLREHGGTPSHGEILRRELC